MRTQTGSLLNHEAFKLGISLLITCFRSWLSKLWDLCFIIKRWRSAHHCRNCQCNSSSHIFSSLALSGTRNPLSRPFFKRKSFLKIDFLNYGHAFIFGSQQAYCESVSKEVVRPDHFLLPSSQLYLLLCHLLHFSL